MLVLYTNRGSPPGENRLRLIAEYSLHPPPFEMSICATKAAPWNSLGEMTRARIEESLRCHKADHLGMGGNRTDLTLGQGSLGAVLGEVLIAPAPVILLNLPYVKEMGIQICLR